eukprot:g15689.t1
MLGMMRKVLFGTACAGLSSLISGPQCGLVEWSPIPSWVSAGGHNQRGNPRFADVPDLSRADRQIVALTLRAALDREAELDAEEGGWILPDAVSNVGYLRGISTLKQMPLDHIRDVLSAWGKINLSEIRRRLVHVVQFEWLLSDVGLAGHWTAFRF